MRFVWIVLLLLVSLLAAPVGPLLGGQFEGLATGILAMYAKPVPPGPAPTPLPPAPSDICENCRGTGKLGDGTISVTCPVCDGTGKKKVAVAAPVPTLPKVIRRGYPLRSGFWSGCSSWHHMTQGEHAQLQLDPAWLKPMPWNELQSLHADAHEGRIKWQYVQRLSAKRPGGHYRWECDGRSCGWKWVPCKEMSVEGETRSNRR